MGPSAGDGWVQVQSYLCRVQNPPEELIWRMKGFDLELVASIPAQSSLGLVLFFGERILFPLPEGNMALYGSGICPILPNSFPKWTGCWPSSAKWASVMVLITTLKSYHER